MTTMKICTFAGVVVSVVLAADVLPAAETACQKLKPVAIQQVTIEDEFWSPKRKIWREVTIPDVLAKFEKDGAVRNFDRVRDGEKGDHAGPPFLDGLFYETMRGISDFLAVKADSALEKRIDGYVEHIAAAQAKDSDGYLNTWTTLLEPNHRWGLNGGNDIIQHDIYNAGALIEAGVHYYRATGKTRLLEIAARLANHMCDVMGPPPRKNIVPGHALSEEATADLYRLFREKPELKKEMPFPVDENRYLKLAEFWIEYRGNHHGRGPWVGFENSYTQDHLSVMQQPTIEGHAVRATLMCAGLSSLAAINGRDDYRAAAERLWRNMTNRRMYITGGVGATAEGEAFAADYILPNDGYLESCAAVGSAFFSRNMNLLCGEARYADELERVLYNGALCAVSLKGDTYYYQNPLEVRQKSERWTWHGCPCCPPMFLKLMGAMPGYVFAVGSKEIAINLYVGCTATIEMAGTKIEFQQRTRYPWDGNVSIALKCDKPTAFDLCLRVPGWCEGASRVDDLYTAVGRPAQGAFVVKVNGNRVDQVDVVRGYVRLPGVWKNGDTIELAMDMPVWRILANPAVKADVGRVAIMRGPVVYCLESTSEFDDIRNCFVGDNVSWKAELCKDLLGGVVTLSGAASAAFLEEPRIRPASLTLTPYYANANRGTMRMMVWIPRTGEVCHPAGSIEAAASHCCPGDSVDAMHDRSNPKNSADEGIPRFTWWDHRGTSEWVQYSFARPRRISAVEVYWWDETKLQRHCRVPQSWRVLYKDGDGWKPVANASGYGTKPDQYSRTTFLPVETSAIRIEAQLQKDWSGGILQWRLD